MDFACRSFATRLERRRTVLISSLRFYRLVDEVGRDADDAGRRASGSVLTPSFFRSTWRPRPTSWRR